MLNYDKLIDRIKIFEFSMEFEFNNVSALKLIRSLRILPEETNEDKRINIKLGKSFDKVDFYRLIELLKESYLKVNIDIKDVRMEHIVNKYIDYQYNKETINKLCLALERIPLDQSNQNKKLRFIVNKSIIDCSN